jgi:carboxypeptidase PM20D1
VDVRTVIRTFLFGAGALVIAFAAFIVGRTMRFSAPATGEAPVQQASTLNDDVDSSAVQRLSEAIRIPTVTYFDSTPRLAEFTKLRALFERAYPLVHARLRREIVDSGTLIYTWPGSDTSLAPVLLMGHQDVVPVEPGTEQNWKQPPFSGAIAEGFVWGRGTLDDKITVLGLLEGAEALLKRGYQPRRSVIFVFGHTEEGSGPSTVNAARLLESRGIRPTFVMDEGGAMGEKLVPGVARRVALVGVAEKGYLSLRLTARAEGGHSSMPRPDTAVTILAEAVNALQEHPLPLRLNGATRAMLQTVGPYMPFSRRVAMANLWLFEPAVVRMASQTPAGNASVRTTTATTMLSAGIKDNVVPQTASAVVNFRLLPGDSVAWVVARVKEIIADDRVAVETVGSGVDATAVSPHDADGFKTIAQAIRDVFPGTVVSPYLVIGGTDARHFSRISPNVYRFLPMLVEGETLSLLHGTNERVGVQTYLNAVRFYTRLIETSSR